MEKSTNFEMFVEALRTHYIHEFCVIDKDLSDDDEELPFK